MYMQRDREKHSTRCACVYLVHGYIHCAWECVFLCSGDQRVIAPSSSSSFECAWSRGAHILCSHRERMRLCPHIYSVDSKSAQSKFMALLYIMYKRRREQAVCNNRTHTKMTIWLFAFCDHCWLCILYSTYIHNTYMHHIWLARQAWAFWQWWRIFWSPTLLLPFYSTRGCIAWIDF